MVVKIIGQAAGGIGEKQSYTILDSWIAAGLTYVSSFKRGSPVRAINASFGQFRRSRSIAIQAAALAHSGGNSGTLIVGAAGNEDSNKMQFPAGYVDSIAVANIDRNQQKHLSSNFGSWVDIAAPGELINSSVPGERYEDKSGTSMAAPFVAGIAGLVVTAHPDISTLDLRSALLNSGEPSMYGKGLNTHYLAKVPGEATSIPLLGTGIIKAIKPLN